MVSPQPGKPALRGGVLGPPRSQRADVRNCGGAHSSLRRGDQALLRSPRRARHGRQRPGSAQEARSRSASGQRLEAGLGRELRRSARRRRWDGAVFLLREVSQQGVRSDEKPGASPHINPMRKWLKGQIMKLFVGKQKTTKLSSDR